VNHLLHGGALVQRMRVLRALTLTAICFGISLIYAFTHLLKKDVGEFEGLGSVIVTVFCCYISSPCCIVSHDCSSYTLHDTLCWKIRICRVSYFKHSSERAISISKRALMMVSGLN
jgi:hypothetical protein